MNRLIAWIAGVWVLLVITLATLESLFGVQLPVCNFKRLTGWPCASCGGTTATKSLLTGNVFAALSSNPLVTMMYFVLAVWLGAFLISRTTRKWTKTAAKGQKLWIVLLVVIAANWMYLIIRHSTQGG